MLGSMSFTVNTELAIRQMFTSNSERTPRLKGVSVDIEFVIRQFCTYLKRSSYILLEQWKPLGVGRFYGPRCGTNIALLSCVSTAHVCLLTFCAGIPHV